MGDEFQRIMRTVKGFTLTQVHLALGHLAGMGKNHVALAHAAGMGMGFGLHSIQQPAQEWAGG